MQFPNGTISPAPMERCPEPYRKAIQEALSLYWQRRVWELEQTVLGWQARLVAPDVLYNSALADELVEIARVAAGLPSEELGVVYEGIQDLMERLFSSPILGTYDIPQAFWATPLGAMVNRAIFRVRGDELISITEAAEILGTGTQAVSNRIACGDLAAYPDPTEPNPQRARRVARSEVERLRQG